MKRIMIVEDDKTICEELCSLLHHSGYEAIILQDFIDPLSEILANQPDLLLLDINIPYGNGELLLQALRKKSSIPVIMVTSRCSELDEALSISYGADDYVTKPYNPTILLLRIAAVLKRTTKIEEFLSYKDLDVNMQRGTIKRGNIVLNLTKNEMIIFNYLLHHQNRIVTRDELMTDLWDNDEYINDNALTVNMSRLRAKLKEVGYEQAIVTRKGLGYILQ